MTDNFVIQYWFLYCYFFQFFFAVLLVVVITSSTECISGSISVITPDINAEKGDRVSFKCSFSLPSTDNFSFTWYVTKTSKGEQISQEIIWTVDENSGKVQLMKNTQDSLWTLCSREETKVQILSSNKDITASLSLQYRKRMSASTSVR